jgi:6-phosphogluconate dehydrogenase (decarboxylating)
MVTDTAVPIVVDLDRTLTPTNTLQESLVRLMHEHPARLLWLPAWLPRDRARFKRQVSAHGSFYDVIASDGRSDFKGDHKRRAIHERVGEHFVYAGGSRAELPIWRAASGAIMVGVSRHVPDQVQACGIAVEAEFAQWGWRRRHVGVRKDR